MRNRFFVILSFLIVSYKASAQCAMCKAVVENGDNDMAQGINDWYRSSNGFPIHIGGNRVYFLVFLF